jgi:hypothetical protein
MPVLLDKGVIDPKTQRSSSVQSALPGTQHVGALVVGGCSQGLGIVRSLGRRGVPVCVVDDEFSVSRYSRYYGTLPGYKARLLKAEAAAKQ